MSICRTECLPLRMKHPAIRRGRRALRGPNCVNIPLSRKSRRQAMQCHGKALAWALELGFRGSLVDTPQETLPSRRLATPVALCLTQPLVAPSSPTCIPCYARWPTGPDVWQNAASTQHRGWVRLGSTPVGVGGHDTSTTAPQVSTPPTHYLGTRIRIR